MADYRVNLDVFAGPMDLLLYLVRKEEVDIYDIPIARITEQYIMYIEMLKNLDIDLAGDFLVMASSLMQIKSAMLLPKAGPDDIEAEDFEDPRAELIRQLLEYKKFKDAANLLDACAVEQQQRTARPDTIINRLKDNTEPEVDMDNVSVWDLLGAFDNILQATGASFDISHIHDDTPIDLYQIEILHRLQTEGAMPFERIFDERDNRLVLVGLFLAILELIKDSLIGAEQQEGNGAIYLSALTDEPAEQAVQKVMIAAAEQASESAPVPIVEIEQSAKPQERIETVQTSQNTIPIAEIPAERKQQDCQDYSTPRQKDENNTADN
ncbi:MAG: segregation/condensation protein A [Sedimentisphaerales bacterium]|nr:segregation/condensation protein A [Sedimentisphaerales bacterium]